jgi:hypothetical protein
MMARVQGCGMKSKQLANVLIKIVGLYVCLGAIPNFVSGILIALSPLGESKWNEIITRTVFYAVGAGVQAVVGIVIIIKSRKLAEFWFKNEDE